ncbi:MAG TPA: hypothetical protein PKA06_11425 [Gemmatales bacterium]|nr:hypothetical protein [Gemmatales bacterium]
MRYLVIFPIVLFLNIGCVSTDWQNDPAIIRGSLPIENPLFVPQGHDPQQYQRVYDTVYDICQTYFDIANSNMYAGEITGVPRLSAGIFDWFRYEYYDGYEIWQSTVQSIRRRLQVQITPAEVGGYFVLVRIQKELEDPGQLVNVYNQRRLRPDDPIDAQNSAAPSGRNPVSQWIDIGRDTRLETLIISKLKEKL